MNDNTIYKVLNITNVLNKIKLTDIEKIFIISKGYSKENKLDFFITDYDYKTVLLAKNVNEQVIYKFPFARIDFENFISLIRDKSIIPTQYALSDNKEKITIDKNGNFFLIDDIPNRIPYLERLKNNMYRANIRIKDKTNKMCKIFGYGLTKQLATKRLMEAIDVYFNSYLCNEENNLSCTNEILKDTDNIDTLKRVFVHTDLDTTVKTYKKLLEPTEDLDMENEA